MKLLRIFCIITSIVNLERGIFPDELKLAKVVPVYEKNDKKDKSNYRPISILSKI